HPICNEPACRDRQLGMHAERAVALWIWERRGPAHRPASKACKAGASHIDAAIKDGGFGGSGHGTLKLGAAAAGHSQPYPLDLEPVLCALDGDMDIADHVARQICLIDCNAGVRAAAAGQEIAQPDRKGRYAFGGRRAFASAEYAIEVEPA